MKISELKVILICPDHTEYYNNRKVKTQDLLERLGCKEIIHYKSDTANYPTCLRKANIDILQTYIDEPILIVEDDLGYTGIDSFNYEEDADAYYLGYSKFGGHPTENTHIEKSQFVPHSDTMVRVINTLTAHAILYISRKYKEAVINILSQDLDRLLHQDILMTRILNNFKILAPKKPIFFQSSRFHAPEDCTNFTILDDMSWGPPQKEVVFD